MLFIKFLNTKKTSNILVGGVTELFGLIVIFYKQK